jgi:LacI family transcriptional regulator
MARVPRMPVTVREVARLAGVHPATVSRALNDATRDLVAPETARRVDEAVQRLGYRPNPLARGLRTRRSLSVGVVVPDLTNPLFPPIVRGIEDALDGAGYTALIVNTDGGVDREQRGIASILDRQADGLILAAATLTDAIVAELTDRQVPLVLVNRRVDDERVDAVTADDRLGIRLAVDHLHDLGHRHVGHVAGPSATSTGYTRLSAFRTATRRRGLVSHVVTAAAFTSAAGATAAATLLRHHPDLTAIVAGNDLIALGCLDALRERGLRCPEDVSVVGFNDMPFVDRIHPPLTTIHVPHYALGEHAAMLLLSRMRDGGRPARQVVVEVTLVVRGSTSAAPIAGP